MIEQTTPMGHIEAYIQQEIERVERAIIYNFEYVGIQCINKARDEGSYTDRSGNLRSSIGYAVVKDGKIVSMSTFEIEKEGVEGASQGKEFIKQLVAQYPQGIALIVVAGMDYAAAVEAKNFDVLTSAELLAEQMVPDIMKRLGFITK